MSLSSQHVWDGKGSNDSLSGSGQFVNSAAGCSSDLGPSYDTT